MLSSSFVSPCFVQCPGALLTSFFVFTGGLVRSPKKLFLGFSTSADGLASSEGACTTDKCAKNRQARRGRGNEYSQRAFDV